MTHEQRIAELETLLAESAEVLETTALELAWMIDQHNVQCNETGSWHYDHQTPWDAMQHVKKLRELSNSGDATV